MAEPQTTAGRTLLDRWGGVGMPPNGYDPLLSEWLREVLAIEAEARAAALSEARAAVERQTSPVSGSPSSAQGRMAQGFGMGINRALAALDAACASRDAPVRRADHRARSIQSSWRRMTMCSRDDDPSQNTWLRGDWMQTFTGKRYYPQDPKA